MALTPEQKERAFQIYLETHRPRIGATGTWADEEIDADKLGLELAKKEKEKPTKFIEPLKVEGKGIPYWTGEGEIKWRHKELTDEQMNQLSFAKDIRLLRETADLGDRMEAFTQGLLPVGDKELYEKAFPISNLGGHLARLVGTSAITAQAIPGIHDFMMNARLPYIVSESIPRMTAFAIQRALTYGADELAGNITRGVTGGTPLGLGTLVKEPLKEAGVGSLYGIAHGIADANLAASISAGISGGRTILREYIKDGKITNEDITEAMLMAGFTMLVERIGHEQMINKWHDKETAQFAFDKAHAKYMARGLNHNEATTAASLELNGFHHPHATKGLGRAVYEKVIKPALPEQLFTADQKTQLEIISEVQERLKHNMPMASAIGETITNYMGELQNGLPFLAAKEKIPLLPKWGEEKPVKPKEEPKLVTPNLMRYGKQLEAMITKNLGYTEDDIKTLKNGKSFSYKKENAMTPKEAAEVINEYEDLIEQSAYLGGGHKKLLKEMDVLRAKFLKAYEKGVFSDLTKLAIPDELKDQVGAKFYFTDWIRPSWRVFRKDPIVNKHGYLPMAGAYGKAQRFSETSILEARHKVKELKLTPDERRRVTIKRHIEYFWSIGQDLHRELPTLNDRERAWDDWLTSHFEGLHKFFNVPRMIPYNLYIPLLQDVEGFESSLLNELYPDYLPKNITAFFEHRRQSKKAEKFREDSLDLYEMYVRAGAKRHYMLPAIREARKNVIKNKLVDATMKSHFQDWGTWMMGYPAMADATFAAMFEKFGLNYDQAYAVARTLMNLVYMGGIGFRPMAALRNILQNLNTACELGYAWMGAGMVELAQEGTKRARDSGVLMEYAPEIYTELGQHTEMKKLMHATMFLYRKADEINRSVAYYAAEKKFGHYYSKYGNTDKFFKESGIRFLDKAKRAEIKTLLNDGRDKEAKDIFGKEIAAKTQYLYKKETSPLIQKTLPGKLLFQFKSWPENYFELLTDWGMNKNYAAFARALLAYTMLGFIGNQLGQKWLIKSIPVGTLPVEQWRFERTFIPATLGPIADIMFLMTAPMYTGFETQNPEAVAKKFQKRLKRLGKDILLYIPGGLAMKDLYRVAPFIPFSTRGEQESARLGVERIPTQKMPTQRLPVGRL